MEHHQKNKRARDDQYDNNDNDDEAESKRIMPCLENNKKGKKRDICGISFTNKEKKEMEENGCLALGVFDFPWLKDGTVIFKYEDNFMDFEHNFLSSLEPRNNKDTFFNNVTSGFHFFEECEESSMPNIPEAKLVDDVWPLEGNEFQLQEEEFDCIWSSLT